MSTATALLGLLKAVDADDSEAYLKTSLAGSLDTLDNAVLLASVQTLTNKTLTSPSLTSPVITSGNLTADFTNATVANRSYLQSSTTNGSTIVGLLPNGNSTTSAARLYNTNDPANAGFVQISSAGTFSLTSAGTGTAPTAYTFTNGSNVVTLNQTLAAASNPLLDTTATDTITGGVTDAYTGGIRLAPIVNAATAQTVTRLNYIDANNVTVGGVGPAAVTAAYLIRFNAAAGTHKALGAATTKTTPSGVDAWINVNLNGTAGFVPVYLSKTA